MAKLIPTEERIKRARKLIQQARDLEVPTTGLGKSDFSYIAEVKDLFRQARDLVKFIPYRPTATPELKAEVQAIFDEADQARQRRSQFVADIGDKVGAHQFGAPHLRQVAQHQRRLTGLLQRHHRGLEGTLHRRR